MTDPWRYACPECGSVEVKALTFPRSKRVVAHGKVPNGKVAEDIIDGYRCRSCQSRIPDVYDKKRGVRVQPHTSDMRTN